jgi:hypothetical protein
LWPLIAAISGGVQPEREVDYTSASKILVE